jgi:hypothetical protein
MTVTAAWCLSCGKVSPNTKDGPYAIRIYHPLCGHYLMIKGLRIPENPDAVTLK